MSWTNISNALVAVGALPFATTMQALRDNPIAIAAGDVGAPRIQTAAIQDSAVTSAKLATGSGEVNWVLARTAGATRGAVGTYTMAAIIPNGVTVAGNATRAGSDLGYARADASVTETIGVGTWRNMGASVTGVATPGAAQVTQWLRIA